MPKPWRPSVRKATDEQCSAVLDMVRRGRRDPVWFVEHVLKAPLWEGQRDIVRSVWDSNRTACKAAHSVGKTYVAARIAIAWHYLYPDSRVITTAPTWSQVSKLLWAEIGAAHAKLPPAMGGTLLGTELRSGPEHFMLGLSTDESDRFQGHHARGGLLVILDEGPGVRGDIWEAAFSLMAGGNSRLLAIGNPTETSGPFYDAFTSQRGQWSCQTISALDSPNLADLRIDTETGARRSDDQVIEHLMGLGEDELSVDPLPYLTTRRWVRDAALEWGVGSSPWASRVLGEFPLESDDSLIALTWLDSAVARGLAPDLHYEPGSEEDPCEDPDAWQIGIDAAGPGSDETVVCVRHGRTVVDVKAWSGRDARGDVLATIAKYREHDPLVCVDSVGIGYYLARAVQDDGWTVSDVNVGRPAVDKSRFANWKAELYWGLRDRLQKGGIDLPDDRKLISQASALKYRYDSRGKVCIESKDEILKRGGKSPDRLEALMLSFAASNRLSLTKRTLSQEILI